MLATIVTVLLVGGLCLIPRRGLWKKLELPIAAFAILAAFTIGSWLIASTGVAISSAADGLTLRGVPAWAVVFGPLALIAVLGLLGRLRRARQARSSTPSTTSPRTFLADASWYTSEWQQDPANPAHDIGTAGYRLEMLDGPLAGRTARLRDSRFRLWVASPVTGGELIVRGAIERPELQGVTLLGTYEFSHGDEAMVWTPVARTRS